MILMHPFFVAIDGFEKYENLSEDQVKLTWQVT